MSSLLPWSPYFPQDPLHAMSDYFVDDGGTLDPKWTVWDPGANTTISLVGSSLVLSQPSAGSSYIGGVLQAVPAVDAFLVTVDVKLIGNSQGVRNGGIVIGNDLLASPSTSAFYTFWKQIDGTPNQFFANDLWNDYGHYASTPRGSGISWGSARLVRMAIDLSANTYVLLLSPDGEEWNTLGNPLSFGSAFTPDSVGIGINNWTSNYPGVVKSRFFRIDETDDWFLPCGGIPTLCGTPTLCPID